MAKLPPSDHDDVKPRNKRRYDPRDDDEGQGRGRDMPRKSGGRPQDDEDDWLEDDAFLDDDVDMGDEDDGDDDAPREDEDLRDDEDR